jgi:hypothetical protein
LTNIKYCDILLKGENMSQFYAYLWLRDDGTPFYVGKGSGNRAFSNYARRKGQRCPEDRSKVLILERNLEQEAFETEKELIANWGRKDLGTGCLYNQTDGGDGYAGVYKCRLGEANPFFGKKHVDGFRKGHLVSEKNSTSGCRS